MFGRSPLQNAILNGSCYEAASLIDEGASVNHIDQLGNSALHYACWGLEVGIVDKLLDEHCSVNKKNHVGETPWHCAVLGYYTNNGIAVHFLADELSDPNYDLRKDAIIEKLLNSSVLVNIQDLEGRTVLHNAILRNLDLKAMYLLNRDIENMSTKIEDNSGNTPLHYACLKTKPELVEKLIRKFANVNVQNGQNQTPLHCATSVKVLNPNTSYGNEINKKVERIVTALLRKHVDVFELDSEKKTPLHLAILNNLDSVLELLLEEGCATHIRDKYNNTPLHYACLRIKKDLVKKLRNVDVNSQNIYGDTPLHCVCKSNATETQFHNDFHITSLICDLLHRNADINKENFLLETPLHVVCKSGQNSNVVKTLIDNGAKLNIKTTDGKTALHLFCSNICSEVVVSSNRDSTITILMESGCDVDIKDNNGKTPLFLASKSLLSAKAESHRGVAKKVFSELLVRDSSLCAKKGGQSLADLLNKYPNGWKKDMLHDILIPLKCANLIHNWTPNHSNALRTSALETRCYQELELMKAQVFGQYTLYSVFKNYKNPLFIYEARFEQAINEPSLAQRYPIYSAVLKTKYSMAKKRLTLMEKVTNKRLIKELPKEVVWEELTYLEDSDLKSAALAVGVEAYVQ